MEQRTLITKMVLHVVAEVSDKQDQKGVREYGQSLDQVPLNSYEWNMMALEEVVDALKYQIMENARLKERNELLVKQLSRYQRIWTNEGDL
jgi:histidinol dehydrogenase